MPASVRIADVAATSAPPLVVHLRAADGATFDLELPAPAAVPRVRLADVRAYSIQSTYQWDGQAWQPTP